MLNACYYVRKLEKIKLSVDFWLVILFNVVKIAGKSFIY